jgi:hypothetical protein
VPSPFVGDVARAKQGHDAVGVRKVRRIVELENVDPIISARSSSIDMA